MLKLRIVRSSLTLLLAGLLWSASDSVTLAAKAPVLVSNTAWDTTGTLAAKLQGAPTLKVQAQALVSFSVTAEGLFEMDISDGVDTLEVPGTYAQDPRGKLSMLPDAAALQTEIHDMIVASLTEQGYPPESYKSLEVLFQKLSTKAKAGSSTKTGDFLQVKFQVKFVALLTDLEDFVSVGKGGYSYNGKGGKLPPGI